MKFYKDKKFLCFVGGFAAAIVGGKIARCPKTRVLCVNGLAKGMKLHQDAKVSFQNMKEDAADLCHEARQQAQGEDTAE